MIGKSRKEGYRFEERHPRQCLQIYCHCVGVEREFLDRKRKRDLGEIILLLDFSMNFKGFIVLIRFDQTTFEAIPIIQFIYS